MLKRFYNDTTVHIKPCISQYFQMIFCTHAYFIFNKVDGNRNLHTNLLSDGNTYDV